MSDQIICGDCLEVMPTLEDRSVDMILADLPYGVTACKWDTPLPLGKLWEEFTRIAKPNAAMVFTAQQPFTSQLIYSNQKAFRYCLVWEKTHVAGFLNAKRMPLRKHEDIIVFYPRLPTYNPQGTVSGKFRNGRFRENEQHKVYGRLETWKYKKYSGVGNYPTSIIKISNPTIKGHLHGTQKPVALFEYLIRTYTNEGDTVLDPTAGSGTTAIACRKTGRQYICIEKEAEYCAIAEKRIAEML